MVLEVELDELNAVAVGVADAGTAGCTVRKGWWVWARKAEMPLLNFVTMVEVDLQ